MASDNDPGGSTAAAEAIRAGRTSLGIELGSTRIKAALIGPDQEVLAGGGHDWENQYVDGLWTYSLDSVWTGLQESYAELAESVESRYGVELTTVGALGVSAMMHGYLAFDAEDELLVPFRTWRNTHTGAAVAALSSAFEYNIPHRWSVANHYQAILDQEEHVGRVAHLTTLAGYVHWQLSGEKVLGIGDASGMFPIDTKAAGYDQTMITTFDRLAADAGVRSGLADLLPTVLVAGRPAGQLTEEGAARLDRSGRLRPGVAMCPPEGDAGTGMVATNSVAPRTGNISAGTSIFAMVVLEHPLERVHHELDLVTTPAGDLVAMVHCNNGASELDAWAQVFGQFAAAAGQPLDRTTVFETLFTAALDGEPDGGGLVAYNYLAGEPITEVDDGRPLVLRTPDSALTLANFVRTLLYSAFATLRIGMDVLHDDERVEIDRLFAHGGLFRTKGVAQRMLAAAVNGPVSVGEVAAEGGAWGIAVLADYLAHAEECSLAKFLDETVFATRQLEATEPDSGDVDGFTRFLTRYLAGLDSEKAAAAVG